MQYVLIWEQKDKPAKNSIGRTRENREMAGGTVRKERGDRSALVFQCDPAFIGNADEDSGNFGSERKGFD